MRVITNAAIRVRNLVVHEFPLLVGAVFAALNTVGDQSVKAYALAAGTAALRFVVSPAFTSKAINLLSATQVEAIKQAVDAAVASRENPEASA